MHTGHESSFVGGWGQIDAVLEHAVVKLFEAVNITLTDLLEAADLFFRAGAKCVEEKNYLAYWFYNTNLKKILL